MCDQSRTYKASIRLFFLNVIKFIINLVLSNNEGKTLEMEGQPDADTGKHIDEVVKLIQILSNREYDSENLWNSIGYPPPSSGTQVGKCVSKEEASITPVSYMCTIVTCKMESLPEVGYYG